MRVLVTGGGGYIGSVAVERLLARGDEVVVLDNFWRGHRAAVFPAQIAECDLRDAEGTRRVVRDAAPDAVLHFAAAIIVPESMTNPIDYFGINVVGSHNLLAAMVEGGVRTFVFSSTAAVYGLPETLPIVETSPTTPINPYGRSKLMVEQMVEWHAHAYGLRYAALRYFNVAGATDLHGEDHHPESHVIPVALQVLLGQRDHFSVFGTDYPTPDGTAIRDYVHVVDLIDAHLLALDRLSDSEAALGAFNLGTKGGFSVKEIVASVERVTGGTLAVEYGPRREGDPPALIADSTRARSELGWHPERSTLDTMVGDAWAWHRCHPDGYARE